MGLRQGMGESLAVDRERSSGRDLIGVGAAHDERAEPPHFRVQQADGVRSGVVGAEGIGADQLGQPVGPVRVGSPFGAHLV
jgi:hypothetical protein